MIRVGLIQMTSGPTPVDNFEYLKEQTDKLAKQGAQLVITPENALVFGERSDYHRFAEDFDSGTLQQWCSQLASDNRVWLVIGSMPIKRAKGVTTTSLLYSPDGRIVADYDKLHMFDVDIDDHQSRYRESDTFLAGEEAVSFLSPIAHIGMSICYDIRFPSLYGMLREKGVNLMLVPAAFTAVTGRAHWEVLARARAIETQSWLIAVNQVGIHPCGRETWGHSMVISPWGEIVASLKDIPDSLVVDIDINQVEDIRASMPVSQHQRFGIQFEN